MSAPTVRITSEITVDRCTVRVIRHGGWSWGPDPQLLVRLVMEALPDLLAERFAEQLAGDGPDLEISEPITLTARLRPDGTGPVPEIVLGTPINEQYFAVTAVVEEAPESVPVDPFVPELSSSPVAVARMFAELAERDELEPLLALLPDESVRVYLLALLEAADTGSEVSTVVELLRAELNSRNVDPLIADEEAQRVAEAVSTVERRVSPAVGETQVWSVLPFLLAGPLARIGYLDAIGPALAGAGMPDDTPLFAAALAYKVLGVTERGWRRAERDRAAAAAFAGLGEQVPDEQLAGLADRILPALPVLDGVLALALCRGHEPAEPLLISGVDGRLLLVDTQGMFPIAWSESTAGLVPHWEACGKPPVLVCAGTLPPRCLSELASAGVRFVTDVRPLRGDPVSRMPWKSPLWRTEGADPRWAAELPGQAERLGDLVQALVVERRAVPLAANDDLERSLTLAAALGLGTIAWMLWRDRETPDPVLALSRFADLEASVRYEQDVVRVRVPLGRRHADLLRCGLLADVPNVVWLGGRTLTFSGG